MDSFRPKNFHCKKCKEDFEATDDKYWRGVADAYDRERFPDEPYDDGIESIYNEDRG